MEASLVAVLFAFSMKARLETELAGFPPRQVVAAQMTFIKAHAVWLDHQIRHAPPESEIHAWDQEQDALWLKWCKLQSAQDCQRPLAERLRILMALRIQLTRDSELAGRMPFAVPVKRFREGAPPAVEMKALEGIMQNDGLSPNCLRTIY
ncbi:MAG: hypothetical protein ACJ8FY_10050 [Gemmataceae bacterium]